MGTCRSQPPVVGCLTRVGEAVADAVQQERGAVAERRHGEHGRQVAPQLPPSGREQGAARDVLLADNLLAASAQQECLWLAHEYKPSRSRTERCSPCCTQVDALTHMP